MSIKIGTNSVNNIYIGNTQVSKIYLGNNEIYSSFNYDYVDPDEYDEIDILYTTDNHGSWLGYDNTTRSDWASIGIAPKFTYEISGYQGVLAYKNKLESENSIKVLCLDGGDFAHCSFDDEVESYRKINNDYGLDAALAMNEVGYFGAILGNHEFKCGNDGQYGKAVVEHTLKKFVGNSTECSIISCNLINTTTGDLEFKPYKTAKIGSKKIAIIGASYCERGNYGFDGNEEDWITQYSLIRLGSELYSKIQGYIDLFKANNFDHIGLMYHGGVSTLTTIVSQLDGLTFCTTGHDHNYTSSSTITDKGGNSVHVVAQPRCAFYYMSRARIIGSTITSSAIQSY